MSLSERQYIELRDYEGRMARSLPEYQKGLSPVAERLVNKGFLRPATYGSGFYEITLGGEEALADFRTKHGLAVAS